MVITAIKQQVKSANRYSIFVEGKYSFSLSETALLESKITNGQELTAEQIAEYKQLSADDKLYNRALNYVALRPRSVWEVEFYLKRKDAPLPLTEQITNKLQNLGLLDDRKFAESFVHDRRLLRSASTRKIQLELRKKHIASEVIEQVLTDDETDEGAMLRDVIERKRQQSKYRDDDLKLMQYLARQGFGYGDIKQALEESKD
ncbi:MAG TPA: RecX family transcriptional regulator [Candidatus Microsaccharimonas sp.]|nr:RecX family transcriptional regulator [Candidatus Microsaccharimonas sp.]